MSGREVRSSLLQLRFCLADACSTVQTPCCSESLPLLKSDLCFHTCATAANWFEEEEKVGSTWKKELNIVSSTE